MKPTAEIRKIITSVEDIHREAGRTLDTPSRKCVIAAVIANPLAGAADGDLEILKDIGADVSARLVARGLEALGAGPDDVQSYGKGAIVGVDGDREHSAAILHPRFGAPVRAAIGGGVDIIPGTKKLGGPGAPITMPIGNKDDRWVFDDMDAVDIAIPDAPHADEIVIALALSCGGRPGARVRKP